MEIRNEKQFNQSIGKSKILSSTAGVGSIVTTKWGGFIMPLSIDKWKFLEIVTNELRNNRTSIKTIAEEKGVDLIEDSRFVSFLSVRKGFSNLKCFAAIPQIQLDNYNKLDLKANPVYKRIEKKSGTSMNDDMFYVPAINFPQWYISSNFELRPLDEWRQIWKKNKCNDGKLQYFVPPRDPNKKTNRKMKNEPLIDDSIYELLKQVPLVLICENGHIADIPWYNYFCAELAHEKLSDDTGFDLFRYKCQPCSDGGTHNLKWLNARNQAESWGTLKCSKCGKTVSLAGIMNIKPLCIGERPWLDTPGTYEVCSSNGHPTKMRVAMITSNSIYYSCGFSSLFIPADFISHRQGHLTDTEKIIIGKFKERYAKKLSAQPNFTKEKFWDKYYSDYDDFLEEIEINWGIGKLNLEEYHTIRDYFLNDKVEVEDDEEDNLLSSYRLTEYEVFTNKSLPQAKSPELEFNEIQIPDDLGCYFNSIKQVNTLALTSIQLGFGRVHMPTSKLVDGVKVPPGDEVKNIFNGTPADVYVLPANRQFGEGLFFAFDPNAVEHWEQKYELDDYYQCKIDPGSIGESIYNDMSAYGRAKFFLLHTFSHLIMKELEFTCGYPTASLSERIYYSKEMCGVLIYTAEGSEGSMGGLVWQGQPRLISHILKSAINRAENCSSDPLCWENQDGLNRASCFSCTMVSETSCEYFNLGLDRRALVDEEFGFFKDLLNK